MQNIFKYDTTHARDNIKGNQPTNITDTLSQRYRKVVRESQHSFSTTFLQLFSKVFSACFMSDFIFATFPSYSSLLFLLILFTANKYNFEWQDLRCQSFPFQHKAHWLNECRVLCMLMPACMVLSFICMLTFIYMLSVIQIFYSKHIGTCARIRYYMPMEKYHLKFYCPFFFLLFFPMNGRKKSTQFYGFES